MMDNIKPVDRILTAVALGLVVFVLLINFDFLRFLSICALFLVGLYYVIKFAVKAALREYDAEKNRLELSDGSKEH